MRSKKPASEYKKRYISQLVIMYTVAGAFLVLSIFIPLIVFKYEDIRTEDYDIHYPAMNQVMTGSGIGIIEKLGSTPLCVRDLSYIYMEEAPAGLGEDTHLKADEAMKKALDDIDTFFIKGVADKIRKAVDESDDSYITPLYMIRTDYKDMFAAWEIYIDIDETSEVLIYIDDETGKILSFDMTIHGIADTPDAYKIGDKLDNRLSEYYDTLIVASEYSKQGENEEAVMYFDDQVSGEIYCDMTVTADNDVRYISFNYFDEGKLEKNYENDHD